MLFSFYEHPPTWKYKYKVRTYKKAFRMKGYESFIIFTCLTVYNDSYFSG